MDTGTAAEADQLLPLGVHFGVPHQTYLDDPGLGSGDVKLLAKNPSSWWWCSRYNPDRPAQPRKKHFEIGTAVHKVLLEGLEAFESVYLRGPDHDSALTGGMKGAATRRFNAEAMNTNRVGLSAEDYDRVLLYARAIKANPFVANVFERGQPEVSVFWEREGVRLKGRFDYLKLIRRPDHMLAVNGDLKTVENIFLDDFKSVCRQHIAKYDYDAQAAHYIGGLAMIPQMIRESRMFGVAENKVADAWLSRFMAPQIRYAWQWIFVQKNDMPIIASYSMTPGMNGAPGSPIFEQGASKVNMGIQRYIDCVERFGFDTPWDLSKTEAPEELVPEEMPYWYGGR